MKLTLKIALAVATFLAGSASAAYFTTYLREIRVATIVEGDRTVQRGMTYSCRVDSTGIEKATDPCFVNSYTDPETGAIYCFIRSNPVERATIPPEQITGS